MTHFNGRLGDEILRELRRPFEPAAVKFKGQSADREGGKALVVPYIDNRLVIERLNAVAGGDWSQEYAVVANSGMWCHLTVCGVTRSDFGSGYQGKGLVSDSMKRAAVQFGVGVSIYASPSVWLPKGDHCDIRISGGEGQKRKVQIYLKDKGIAAAAKIYADWLEATGKRHFGDPLGHGDVAEASGLEADETAGEGGDDAAAAPPALLVTYEADQLRQTCRLIYEEIKGLRGGRTKLPPARFQGLLTDASVSIDALQEFAANLRLMVDELKGQG